MKKILLLGSGELGKEFTIAAKRMGQHVTACDSYPGAPAMQVADESMAFDMLSADALREAVDRAEPDIIVPEIEAIRTECLYDFEKSGIQVVPSARAVNYTMNRREIRELAAVELGLRTARYRYAASEEEMKSAVEYVGLPCVVKPLMSSSGHGQSVIRSREDIPCAWETACHGARGDVMEVIVEEFIHFDYEITLLTVTQKCGPTLFCAPVGHVQKSGDYRESWQPAVVDSRYLEEARTMAGKITSALTGCGIWGVEFFVKRGVGVYFSELSPRPHDTGMVTLAGTQNLNEFELHLRAVLGLPIPSIELLKSGVSRPILSTVEASRPVEFSGLSEALSAERTDFRNFGKPKVWCGRRVGVMLGYAAADADIDTLRSKVKAAASHITTV